MTAPAPFWEKPLEALNPTEWEALCDGCGRCCTLRYECEDSGEITESNVACQLLDCATCRCSDYGNRFARVPACTEISLSLLQDEAARNRLPPSCAYRLRAEGYALADWHPLVAGHSRAMQAIGIGLAGQLINEDAPALETDDE